MSDTPDNKKRAIPEPLAHAMTVNDFPEFIRRTEYIGMVRIQLERMKATAVKERAKTDILDQIRDGLDGVNPLEKYDNALLLLDFLELGVQSSHAVDGMETIKQTWIKDSGQIREAISKTAVVEGMGGS